MSKQLNAEQKTVNQIFSECKKAFLIPEYQRPYSWERDECRTLWDNLYEFAFPNDTITDFDADEDNYFMGTILFFKKQTLPKRLGEFEEKVFIHRVGDLSGGMHSFPESFPLSGADFPGSQGRNGHLTLHP